MKPILFNTDMVKAILDGRKTVTRRVVKPQPSTDYSQYVGYCQDENKCGWGITEYGKSICWAKPLCKPDDILYVRETWLENSPDGITKYFYKADNLPEEVINQVKVFGYKWRPSIHMPKEAARIFLRVTGVRVERLQEITEEQATKEGVNDPYDYQDPSYFEQRHMQGIGYCVSAFAGLWDSTVKKQDLNLYGWNTNPWVYVIEFERINKEEALNA